MKLPLILLLNALVAGTTVFVYDTMRSDPADGSAPAAAADRSLLEARVDALEAKVAARGPELRAIGPEDLVERIVALERQVRAVGPRTTAIPDARAPAATGDAPFDVNAAGDLASRVESDGVVRMADGVELAEKDVATVRRLMEAAEQQQRDERFAERIDRTLERLGMNLSDADRARVIETSQAFTAKMRDTFMAARAADTPREELGTVMEALRADYTVALEQILPASDAAQLATALAPGRGPGDMGGPPRPPGRRRSGN